MKNAEKANLENYFQPPENGVEVLAFQQQKTN